MLAAFAELAALVADPAALNALEAAVPEDIDAEDADPAALLADADAWLANVLA